MTRMGLPLMAIAACLWSEVALSDPPWRRGHHHDHGWGNWGHGPGWGHWRNGHRNWHGWHREHRGWHGRPIIIVPPYHGRRPPVVVIPGYAAPYGHGHRWGYAPHAGETEFRFRVPIR